MLTQVVLESTLNKSGLPSVITKILLQIATKSGNVPWAPKHPKKAKDVMLVGLDTLKSGGKRNVSLVATISSDFCKMFSLVKSQSN